MKNYKFIVLFLLIITALIFCNNIVKKDADASGSLKDLSAKSYIVVDENGKVLAEHDADARKPVASICKLMTSLITLENIEKGNLRLDDQLIASSYACSAEGSQAFLDAGQEYSVRDLLKSVIVASANDSAIVLAEAIAGSEDAFVELMNNRAKELGMSRTLYANSTGLTNGNEQYSTARDTTIILNEISEYNLYVEDCKIWMDKLIHPSSRETELVNTNRLIKYYPYTLTGKTGFTDEAKYCLSSTAKKDNLKLCCVVLGCDSSADRFTDSVTLYNHAYANYKSEKILDKLETIPNNIIVKNGKENAITVSPQKDYFLTLSKSKDQEFNIEYVFNEEISAPVIKGDVVGVAKIYEGNELIDEVALVSNNAVKKQTFKDILFKIATNYATIK